MQETKNPRKIAYLALVTSENIEVFFQNAFLSKCDLKFAKEIAFGTLKKDITLDYVIKNLLEIKKIKPKKRILLKTAIYQHYYMSRVPLFAIIDETIKIAKKLFSKKEAAFFNAVLRKLENIKLNLPEDDSSLSLSIKYSFPKFFIEKLIDQYKIETAKDLLQALSFFPKPQLRYRKNDKDLQMKKVYSGKFSIYQIDENQDFSKLINSSDCYIQNASSYFLLEKLYQSLEKPPLSILDLCASPGGKSLAIHDLCQGAKLSVNDISSKKIDKIKENFKKYNISAEYNISDAREFNNKELYDLIIVDVPCSNSGVFHKRANARWRINPENLKKLQNLQFEILKNAKNLLKEDGSIFYMTCSILEDENEKMIELVKNIGLECVFLQKVLPLNDLWDGGFGMVLKKI
jgi:16S rRNA (cytosine967-C5)-methyltransferase